MDFMLDLGMILPLLVGSEGYALMTTVSGRSAVFPPPFTLPANRRSKVGKFSYSDAGQMNMYLNYAKSTGRYRMKIRPSVWFSVQERSRRSTLCSGRFA